MPRYLLYFSYLGTNFRGVQKQIVKAEPGRLDPTSVSGFLEIALQQFNLAGTPEVYVSSRTDQGVHALRNAAHVDLVRKGGHTFDPDYLMVGLNRYFHRAKADIRIQTCQQVPDRFHARYHAVSRTYVYRLAVRRPQSLGIEDNGLVTQVPFGEWNRCHFVHNPTFDVDRAREAAELLMGVHDFRSFAGRLREGLRTRRRLSCLLLTPGRSCLGIAHEPCANDFDYWDVRCSARSFLYKQVRRTVAVLVAVAQGRVSLAKVSAMLAEPSVDSWDSRAVVVPPHGLYLIDVAYHANDLRMDADSPAECDNKT